MPGQPKQSEIFSTIASHWAKMSDEEKKPYIDEANEDKKRRKMEEQRYNHLRREIEKNYEVGNGSIVRMAGTQNCTFVLRNIFKDKNAKSLASLLLIMNKLDLKNTIEIVEAAIRHINEDSAVNRPIFCSRLGTDRKGTGVTRRNPNDPHGKS
jgi:singapore isolate B (sub-type 7) whole genome shotgun sequence assembly, scaffold_1